MLYGYIKNKNMGKLLVKLGLWVQHIWKKLMCKWTSSEVPVRKRIRAW